MRAMILAAGLGTRLRPLTGDRPKALVEIGGRTLLEITLARLRSFGIHEVIVNLHHFADVVADYLNAKGNFGMHIEISREPELLDTGGGLKKARQFFLDSGEPFLVHNVDVLSAIDFRRMLEAHGERRALATLAVQQRATSRRLLFDSQLRLCGRHSAGREAELVRAASELQPLAFCGIHVISPQIFALLPEEGAFSIIDSYLRLAKEEVTIIGFRADEYRWRDVGTPESLAQAEHDLHDGKLET